MDDRKRILLFAIAGAAVLALLCLLLPGEIARVYISVMHPLALLCGAIFAMQVASVYARELKKSFLFLALFLLLYVPINIQPLVMYLISVVGQKLIYGLLILQVVDYTMLLASCFYTVKVIDVKRMNRYGWVFMGLLLPVCCYIIYLNAQFLLRELTEPAVAVVDIMICVIDQAVVLMLVPVLFLYIQYLKQKAQESITFSFIMGGLILSLFSTYVFELVANAPVGIPVNPLLDAAYLFGYLLMGIGLYANRKYDEWGFKMIEKALR